MPRRRLSPLARDVIWELREAEQDDVRTIRATHAALVTEIDACLLDLKRQGLIEMAGPPSDPDTMVFLTDQGVAALDQ